MKPLALALLATPALADDPACFPRAELVATLDSQYHERQISAAAETRGGMVEIYASPQGTWTLVVIPPADGPLMGRVGGDGDKLQNRDRRTGMTEQLAKQIEALKWPNPRLATYSERAFGCNEALEAAAALARAEQPTDTTGPLGAEWMREQVIAESNEVGGDWHTTDERKGWAYEGAEAVREAIRTIPGPTEADLDAAALARPVVREVVEALKALLQSVCGETGYAGAVRAVTGKAYPWPSLDTAEQMARAALAKAKEAGND